MEPPFTPHDESTSIKILRDRILSEELFMEIGSTSLGRLGPFSKLSLSYSTVRLEPIEVLNLSLARIYQELLPHWGHAAVQRTIKYIVQAQALEALQDLAFDETALQDTAFHSDYAPSFSACIRYTTQFVANLIDQFSIENRDVTEGTPSFRSPIELSAYLRSSKIVSDILDAMGKISDGFCQPITAEQEVMICLIYCQESMAGLHNFVSVARCLQWMTCSQRIVAALLASEYCDEHASSIQRIQFVAALCAEAIDRAAY